MYFIKNQCTFYLNILWKISFDSVQFSHSVMSDSSWPHETQHARPPCLSPTPRVHPNPCPVMPSNHLILCQPFSSCLQSFPASGSIQMSQLFASGGQSIGVSTSTSVLPIHSKTDFLYYGKFESPCNPRDSQESPPTPQFKGINSSVLSFLYSTSLTSIHDYWENHSLDWTELC